ncbi:MAG: bifunctional folylpolyglutamate synthase/dihydrofolate synthase, partial [Arachnia sp.]
MTQESHRALVSQLTSRWPEHRVAPSLSRIRAVMDLMGDPQHSVPVIQVAGTNGKGSTAIMIEALLRASGLRVGRFASPHLSHVRERIVIDGEPITEDRFDEVWEEVRPFVAMVDEQLLDGVECTFFEVITAMAYAAFADAPVDVAVMEVGLGGRWDATSVVDPKVSVICPIGLDHTH